MSSAHRSLILTVGAGVGILAVALVTILSMKPGDGNRKDNTSSTKKETEQEPSSNSRSIGDVPAETSEKVKENEYNTESNSSMKLEEKEVKDDTIESTTPRDVAEKDSPPIETPVPISKPLDEKAQEESAVETQVVEPMSSPRAVQDAPVMEEPSKGKDVEPVDSSPDEEPANGHVAPPAPPSPPSHDAVFDKGDKKVEEVPSTEVPSLDVTPTEVVAEEDTTDPTDAGLPAIETNTKGESTDDPASIEATEMKLDDTETSDENSAPVDAKLEDEEGQPGPTSDADAAPQESAPAPRPTNNSPKKKNHNRRANKKKKGKKRK